MSVSDPLIKELKAYTARFLQVYHSNGFISDRDPNLLPFCVCVENIFGSGVISTANSFGFIRQNDPWTWVERISRTKHEIISYNFTSCFDAVRDCKNVHSNQGRFRLVVRHCIQKKCLHIPVEFLINEGLGNKYYDVNSILGDGILSEILLSVLYHCGKLNFRLDLQNSSFLDLSWILPEVFRVELVPTQNLGMSISFAGEKAIIVGMRSNSVSAECMRISVGDVLDSLNGVQICAATRGRLASILKYQKGLPINLTIIKAVYGNSKQYYPPLVKLFKEINLDLDVVRLKSCGGGEDEGLKSSGLFKSDKKSAGFKVVYYGNVDVGKTGDVKMIDKAFQTLLSNGPVCSPHKQKKCKSDVLFEVGELGVKCVDFTTNEILLGHSFMEISSCGSVLFMPKYFSYIAGEEYCNVAKNFKCFVFMAPDDEVAYTILQGIGQGFQRTHYAV